MLFSDILDLHSSFRQKGSHNDILGDGFLMHANPIYRNVKAFSVKIGCKYVPAYPEYLLLPFHELPNIIKRKEIPYVPGARLMKSVEADRPGVFSIEEVPMPESYHLHEAAHVVAEHFLKKIKVNQPRERILKSILAESFANTVDAMACMFVTDEIHHFFIKQNSYMHPQKKYIQAMASVAESMGFRFAFMLIFFTYVHANFLTSPLSKAAVDDLADKYAPGKKVTAKSHKEIRAICAMGENLDPLFRVTTSGNYFKQQGFEGDIQDLLDFDFMKVFASKSEFATAVEALCDTLAHYSL